MFTTYSDFFNALEGITFSKVNCDDLFAKALHFERMYGSQEELESAASSIARKQEENFRKEQKEAAEKEKAEKRAEKQSKKVGKKNFKVILIFEFTNKVAFGLI